MFNIFFFRIVKMDWNQRVNLAHYRFVSSLV